MEQTYAKDDTWSVLLMWTCKSVPGTQFRLHLGWANVVVTVSTAATRADRVQAAKGPTSSAGVVAKLWLSFGFETYPVSLVIWFLNVFLCVLCFGDGTCIRVALGSFLCMWPLVSAFSCDTGTVLNAFIYFRAKSNKLTQTSTQWPFKLSDGLNTEMNWRDPSF